MTEKKGLEGVIPVVDDIMQKFTGVSIRELGHDISEKIKTPVLGYELFFHLPFKEAKKKFKEEYVSKILSLCYGNVTEVARILDVDRRSIHRFVDSAAIDASKIRSEMMKPSYVRKLEVSKAISSSIKNFEEVLHPKKIEELYRSVSDISQDIVSELDLKPISLKDAEKIFEEKYLENALNENKTITKTAKKIKLRYETLHRKLRDLGLI